MSSNRTWTIVVIAVVAIASLVQTNPAEAQQRRASAQVGANCVGGFQALFDEIEIVPLTSDEEYELLYLREEEKLARDVYLTLADRWELPIFRNIAEAEQRHMDLVFLAIELYSLVDPIVDDTVGEFSNPFFDQLYLEYTTANSIDDPELVVDLTVGAMIEDLDLKDLYDLIEFTDNAHLKLIAHNLAKGSRNHLRAFMRALTAQDATYDREGLDPDLFLDQETFDAILEADMERHMYYTADGEPVPACGAAVGGFGMRRGPGQYNRNGSGSSENGSGECDGTGPHGSGNGSSGDGSGTCDGTGPHGGGQGTGTGTGIGD